MMDYGIESTPAVEFVCISNSILQSTRFNSIQFNYFIFMVAYVTIWLLLGPLRNMSQLLYQKCISYIQECAVIEYCGWGMILQIGGCVNACGRPQVEKESREKCESTEIGSSITLSVIPQLFGSSTPRLPEIEDGLRERRAA